MEHRFVYEAIIEPGEVSGYFVYFPDLPDAFTQAADIRHAALNASEVLELTLADYIEEGIEPPVPTFGHQCDSKNSVVLVSVDVDEEKVRLMHFVDSSEAARLLGLSKGRIAQLAASGQLESVGSGTSRLISLTSIYARLSMPIKPGRPQKLQTA
ncbi:MAG: type II toxin-antitoxin system HicB family antitoxin [Coriobacteriales bacterium]|nr:type II toxin-antitoxin system HicB family antitoxin [Coriobacteriales bacterium]